MHSQGIRCSLNDSCKWETYLFGHVDQNVSKIVFYWWQLLKTREPTDSVVITFWISHFQNNILKTLVRKNLYNYVLLPTSNWINPKRISLNLKHSWMLKPNESFQNFVSISKSIETKFNVFALLFLIGALHEKWHHFSNSFYGWIHNTCSICTR